MNNYPNLDVFILTYNRADYLKQMIESLCVQTAQGFTIKILDNASNDNTTSVINELKNKYKNRNIIHIRNEKNLGLFGNFAQSQKIASNDFTAVFHDDDIVHPELIETLMNLFNKHPRAVMASCGYSTLYNPDSNNWPILNKSYYLWEAGRGEDFTLMLQNWCFAAMIYKTSAYKQIPYRPDLYGIIFDHPFLLEINKLGESILLCDHGLRYRWHKSSCTFSGTRPTKIQIFNCIAAFINNSKKFKLYNLLFSSHCIFNFLKIRNTDFDSFFNEVLDDFVDRSIISEFDRKLIKIKFYRKIQYTLFKNSQKRWKKLLKHHI